MTISCDSFHTATITANKSMGFDPSAINLDINAYKFWRKMSPDITRLIKLNLMVLINYCKIAS